MKFKLEPYHRNLPDAELTADLCRVSSELNKSAIRRTDYEERGKYGVTTYIRRFGSWFSALEKAGLEKTRTPMNVPEEELFENLEVIWTKLGRQPRYAEVQKPLSKFHVGTYENRFGTWRKALERFIDYINNDPAASFAPTPNEVHVEPEARHKTSRTINWRQRFVVMRRDNFKCKYCGRSPATDPLVILHVDHIRAWANGGETILENLQTLCETCNIGKSNL